MASSNRFLLKNIDSKIGLTFWLEFYLPAIIACTYTCMFWFLYVLYCIQIGLNVSR